MESTQRGWDYKLGVKGIAGDYAGTAIEMGITAIALDKLAKSYSKDGKGIFDRVGEKLHDKLKPAFDSAFETMGFPRVNKGRNDTPHSTGHHQNSQAPNNVNKQSGKHLNTPYSNLRPDEASESICYIVSLLHFLSNKSIASLNVTL